MQHLLVLDDNPLILKLCQMVLVKAGYRLTLAESAAQAFRALENQTIAAILLDSGLRSPSAREILQTLDRTPSQQNIPILLFVPQGQDSRNLVEDFPAVSKILQKPFSPSRLLGALQMIFHHEGNVGILKRRQARTTATLPDAPFAPVAPPAPLRVEPPRVIETVATQAPVAASAPAARPALSGQLDIMPLAEILQVLHFQNHTGVFAVEHAGKEVLLYLEKGLIQLATSRNLKREFWIGKVISRSRVVPPQLIEQACKTKFDGRLGEALIDQRILKREQLRQALKEQSCNIIYEVLRWKSGSFTFQAAKELPPFAREAQLDLPLEGLLLEGYRRLDEWKVMEDDLGSPETILERTAQPSALLEDLSSHEKNLLAKFDGSTTLEQAAERANLCSFDVYKLCRQLLSRRLLARRAPEAVRAFDA